MKTSQTFWFLCHVKSLELDENERPTMYVAKLLKACNYNN